MSLPYPHALTSLAAIVVILSSSGCPTVLGTDIPCLAGSRVCDGTVVTVCDPQTGRFVHERVCSGEMVCLSGACVPRGFLDVQTGDIDADSSGGPETESDATALDALGLDGTPDGPQLPDTAFDLAESDDGQGSNDTAVDVVLDDGEDLQDVDTDGGDVPDDDSDGSSEGDSSEVQDAVSEVGPDADMDTGPDAPDSGADTDTVVPDPYNPSLLLFTPVPNFEVTGDFHTVTWHPSGSFAVAAGSAGKLVYFDQPTGVLSAAGSLPGDISDLVALDDGSDFIASGDDDDGGKLWRFRFDDQVPPGVLLEETVAVGFGVPASLVPHPNDARIAVVAHSSNSLAYAYVYDPVAGLSGPKDFNASGGVSDAMWGDPGLFGSSDALITSHGVNGADSRSWIMNAADLVVANGWSPGFGNAGAAAWRPGGNYGVVAGWSSNKLYVFNGTWTLGTLPLPTGASPNGIAWRHDGRRGLVVGRVIASPAYASVVEIRAGDDLSAGYSDALLVNQSIQGFDGPPWFGNSGSQHLLDAAWRPNTACDEGLIVGTDNSSSPFNPTFGTVIRFWDQDDPACD